MQVTHNAPDVLAFARLYNFNSSHFGNKFRELRQCHAGSSQLNLWTLDVIVELTFIHEFSSQFSIKSCFFFSVYLKFACIIR